MTRRGCSLWFVAAIAVASVVELPAEAIVFFAGEPFGADVIDETGAILGVTPFVKRFPPGEYRVTFERDGHRPVIESFVLLDDGAIAIDPRLPAVYAIIDLPEEIGDERVLPDGPYELNRGETAYGIEPLYPRETRLRVFRGATPALIGVAIVSTIWTAFAPPRSTEAAIVPTVVFQAGALASASFAYREDRRRRAFLREWTPPTDPYRPRSAAALAEEARAVTESGDLTTARELYTRLIEDFPAAPAVPEALYTLGRFELIDRNYPAARDVFHRLQREYPVIEYYDRTLLQLARIAFEEGDVDEAEGYLRETTGSDPSVDEDVVDTLRMMFAE